MKASERECKIFADRLNEVMRENGLNQADLIEKCKPLCELYHVQITPSKVSRWCAGQYLPRQDYIMIFAKALSLNPAWLLGVEGADKYMNHRTKAEFNFQKIKEELDLMNDSDMELVKMFLQFLVYRK